LTSCYGQGSTKIEDSLPKEFVGREAVQSILGKLKFLKINSANFGEQHPNWMSIQEQIQEHENALQSMLEVNPKPAYPKPSSFKLEDSLPKDFLKRRDVQAIVQKLKFLRINYVNYGEQHPRWRAIRDQIQEHENALQSMLDLTRKKLPDNRVSSNLT